MMKVLQERTTTEIEYLNNNTTNKGAIIMISNNHLGSHNTTKSSLSKDVATMMSQSNINSIDKRDKIEISTKVVAEVVEDSMTMAHHNNKKREDLLTHISITGITKVKSPFTSIIIHIEGVQHFSEGDVPRDIRRVVVHHTEVASVEVADKIAGSKKIIMLVNLLKEVEDLEVQAEVAEASVAQFF